MSKHLTPSMFCAICIYYIDNMYIIEYILIIPVDIHDILRTKRREYDEKSRALSEHMPAPLRRRL